MRSPKLLSAQNDILMNKTWQDDNVKYLSWIQINKHTTWNSYEPKINLSTIMVTLNIHPKPSLIYIFEFMKMGRRRRKWNKRLKVNKLISSFLIPWFVVWFCLGDHNSWPKNIKHNPTVNIQETQEKKILTKF